MLKKFVGIFFSGLLVFTLIPVNSVFASEIESVSAEESSVAKVRLNDPEFIAVYQEWIKLSKGGSLEMVDMILIADISEDNLPGSKTLDEILETMKAEVESARQAKLSFEQFLAQYQSK
jgi:hypothetical protein